MGPHGINWDLGRTYEPKSALAAVWCKDTKDKPGSVPLAFKDLFIFFSKSLSRSLSMRHSVG